MKTNFFRKINFNRLIFIISIAILVSIINILRVILGAAKTPPGFVYLGVGHYYLDFFEYAQQIAQGIRGHLLVENQFATDDPTKTILGWGQYLIIGRIGGLFHLSVVTTYWLSIFILSFILCILLYKLIKRLLPDRPFYIQATALLISLLAAPFIDISATINGQKIVFYDFWYAPMSLFHRFGGVPHHLMTTIISVIIILIIANIFDNLRTIKMNKILFSGIFISLLLIFLLTFAPFQVMNLVSAVLIVGSYYLFKLYRTGKDSEKYIGILKIILFLGTVLAATVPAALIIRNVHNSNGLFQRAMAWEVLQQYHPPILLLLLTTGPILLFTPFGLKSFFSKITPLKLLFFFFIFFSYLYFASPLAVYFGTFNGRFLTSLGYPLFGVIAVIGSDNLSRIFIGKRTFFLISIISIFIIYFLGATLIIHQSIANIPDISYLPREIFEGFKVLDRQSAKGAVLTSPRQSLGAIVPIFVDRNVYIGRTIFTPNYEQKLGLADRFYQGEMNGGEAKKFLSDNDINFIVLTSLDNYPVENILKYPFLRSIMNNKNITIFKLEK